jgi:hypothetical protein
MIAYTTPQLRKSLELDGEAIPDRIWRLADHLKQCRFW